MISTISGSIYKELDIDIQKEYTYDEIKIIFDNLQEKKLYKIVINEKDIYTNLYNMKKEVDNTTIKLNKITIVFLPYLQEDIDKIKHKQFIKPKQNNDLKTEFNLSQDNLDNDLLFMLFCVNKEGSMLSYASDNLKNNQKLVLISCYHNKSNFKYASNKLKSNILFAKKLLKFHDKDFLIHCFEHFNENVRSDKKIVLKFLADDIFNYEYIGNNLKNKDFLLEFHNLKNFRSHILKYASYECKNDRDLVLKCLKKDEANLYSFTNGNNKDANLDFCSNLDHEKYDDLLDNFIHFNNDREIVIQAIKMNGDNFLSASESLRNDIEIVKLAIMNCYYNISFEDEFVDKYKHVKRVLNNINKILNKTTVKKEQVIDVILEKLEAQIIL